jgi:histidinol dehydrogenase
VLRVLEINDPEVERMLDRNFSFPEDTVRAVESIVARVRAEGDAALCALTAEFDGVRLEPDDLTVREEEITAAYRNVDPDFVASVQLARERILEFHTKQVPTSWRELGPDGTTLGRLIRPVASVGVYVPGGRARYPSSVLMNVIPAKVAGVERVVMTTPPGPAGSLDPHVLVAARETGVDEIYRVGGAQAVAALAYGTGCIARVDKVVGPGNIFVTLAKRAVFGVVGIDILAGPSEVVVVADNTAEPRYVAVDLLAQAEHDPQARVLLITTSRELATRVNEVMKEEFDLLGRPEVISAALAQAAVVIAPDLPAAVSHANRFAPEHLELMVAEPFDWLDRIKNAGAVFLGPFSPVPAGDYAAGPNHVLPTGGTARFFSPLGVEDFIKRINLVCLSEQTLKELSPAVKLMAAVEGLPAHGRTVAVRGITHDN